MLDLGLSSACLTLAGLRDKVIFLAARGEVYASFTVILFAVASASTRSSPRSWCAWRSGRVRPPEAQQALPVRHLHDDVQQPAVRPRALKRLFFERFPDDLRPGRLARIVAHFSTAIEMLIPLALFFFHGGWPRRSRRS